jgi:hypothetical protein
MRNPPIGLLALLVVGCSADALTPLPDDARGRRDAGTETIDAGVFDAGVVFDAGDFDAGEVPDSGSTPELDCQWDAPIPPFECEDDADFCDDIGDAQPAKNLVAGWSRIEGDKVFLQLRFASWPFPGGASSEAPNFDEWVLSRTKELFLLMGERTDESAAPPWAPRLSFCEPSDYEWCVKGERYLTLSETGGYNDDVLGDSCYQYKFPPEVMWTSARDRGRYQAFNVIERVRIARSVPLLEIELDAENVMPPNGIFSWAVLNDFQGADTSLTSENPGFAISKGGMSDDSHTLVPANAWTCPGVHPNPALAAAACAAGASGVCAGDGSAWRCVDGEPMFGAWCQNVNSATCAVFEGHGARCVVGPFDENCSVFDEIKPLCTWGGRTELCGEGDEIDGWACEYRGCGGGGCTFGVDACTDDEAASAPFCHGDMRIASCHEIGHQPTFSDCSTWFPGGTCEDGACTGVGFGWPCDGVGFLCDEGLLCDISEGATMGACVFIDADAGM